jgi:hypothetical protein
MLLQASFHSRANTGKIGQFQSEKRFRQIGVIENGQAIGFLEVGGDFEKKREGRASMI